MFPTHLGKCSGQAIHGSHEGLLLVLEWCKQLYINLRGSTSRLAFRVVQRGESKTSPGKESFAFLTKQTHPRRAAEGRADGSMGRCRTRSEILIRSPVLTSPSPARRRLHHGQVLEKLVELVGPGASGIASPGRTAVRKLKDFLR